MTNLKQIIKEKRIELSKRSKTIRGKYTALVSSKDFVRLNKFVWSRTYEGYAKRVGEEKLIYMHWDVIGKPPKGMCVDHINNNKLDNRRENLRFVTPSQNNWNKNKLKNNKSGFIGVSWHKSSKKWQAQIRANRRHFYLGTFENPEDASKAYNIARKIHQPDLSATLEDLEEKI